MISFLCWLFTFQLVFSLLSGNTAKDFVCIYLPLSLSLSLCLSLSLSLSLYLCNSTYICICIYIYQICKIKYECIKKSLGCYYSRKSILTTCKYTLQQHLLLKSVFSDIKWDSAFLTIKEALDLGTKIISIICTVHSPFAQLSTWVVEEVYLWK